MVWKTIRLPDETVGKKFEELLPAGMESHEFIDNLLDGYKERLMHFTEQKAVEEKKVEPVGRRLTEEEIKAVREQEELYWKRYRLETKRAMIEAFDETFKDEEKIEPLVKVEELPIETPKEENLAIKEKPKRRWPF